MKLHIDFSKLDSVLKKMGRKPNHDWFEETIFVAGGGGLPRSDHGVQGGFVENGRRYIVYIEQQSSFNYKFHIMTCSTLKTMDRQNRFLRYVKTNRKDGLFSIKRRGWLGKVHEDVAKLFVCKNCLSQFGGKGYKGYGQLKWWQNQERKVIFDNFNLDEFFKDASTIFEKEPTIFPDIPSSDGYKGAEGETWDQTSWRTREERGWKCEDCGKNFKDNKQSLHVHHKNKNIRDPSDENLRCLCEKCHAEYHSHMRG